MYKRMVRRGPKLNLMVFEEQGWGSKLEPAYEGTLWWILIANQLFGGHWNAY
jgi:hypothetical protein